MTNQHTASHCNNTLQHTATIHCNIFEERYITPSHSPWLCNTLHHTATTHRYTLQHTATHCNTLHSIVLQDYSTGCNTPQQHTATPFNTQKHTKAPHDSQSTHRRMDSTTFYLPPAPTKRASRKVGCVCWMYRNKEKKKFLSTKRALFLTKEPYFPQKGQCAKWVHWLDVQT